jgi:hypothetical protein
MRKDVIVDNVGPRIVFGAKQEQKLSMFGNASCNRHPQHVYRDADDGIDDDKMETSLGTWFSKVTYGDTPLYPSKAAAAAVKAGHPIGSNTAARAASTSTSPVRPRNTSRAPPLLSNDGDGDAGVHRIRTSDVHRCRSLENVKHDDGDDGKEAATPLSTLACLLATAAP